MFRPSRIQSIDVVDRISVEGGFRGVGFWVRVAACS